MPNIELKDKEIADLIEHIALYQSPNEDGTVITVSLNSGIPITVTLLIGSYFEFLKIGNAKKV